MHQLRIYTLRTAHALQDYATVHWPRHIVSLRAFGVSTHGIWTEHQADEHRLVALISYPGGSDPAEVAAAYMGSPEFTTDMEGFDVSDIIGVEEILLDPAEGPATTSPASSADPDGLATRSSRASPEGRQ